MKKLLYSKKPKLIDKKTNIPIFEIQKKNVNEFSIKNAAEIHDNALSWLFNTHNVNEKKLREDLIGKLKLKKGDKVLVTATGAGNDLEYIAKRIGQSGQIYAQDYAKEMLFAAYYRTKKILDFKKYKIFFSVNDATNLPFKDNQFDATYHFGGESQTGLFRWGLVMDEAHRVKGLPEVEMIARECRAWGTSLILSSQFVDDFDSEVRGNLATIIAHGHDRNEEKVQELAKAIGWSNDLEELYKLDIFQALVTNKHYTNNIIFTLGWPHYLIHEYCNCPKT